MDDVQWRFSHGSKVEAKYCPIEIDGDVKYYICPRNEICCTFGCCISSNFHFYQLWYYWLMVILMFLLCSGGTWWYRYWLHEGHYPTPPPPVHRPHPRHRPPPTRVAYHAGRNTVVVQQIWKPQRNGPVGFPTPPPSYSFVQSTSEAVSQSMTNRAANVPIPPQVAKLKPSPYYQLYGPPPSYDSVVSETLAEQRQLGAESADNCGRPQTSCEQQQTCELPHNTDTQQGEMTVTHDTPAHHAQTSARSHHCDTTALPK